METISKLGKNSLNFWKIISVRVGWSIRVLALLRVLPRIWLDKNYPKPLSRTLSL